MGLVYDRIHRRDVMERAVHDAIVDAIYDALASYDDNDAELLRGVLAKWLEIDIPDAVGGKAIEVDA